MASCESLKKKLKEKKNSLSATLDSLNEAKMKVDSFLVGPLHPSRFELMRAC